MIQPDKMQKLATPYGITLDEKQLRQLNIYAQNLVEWNEKINLTAITDPEGIAVRHFLDSLLLANQPEVVGALVDVGSGAGFPGLVAKIYKPELKVTLMEPTGKRLAFLEDTGQKLGVQVELVKERAEEAARKTWREHFDVATARAVAALPALCEYCLPLVRVGGWFIAMKADVQDEVESSRNAIHTVGGRLEDLRHFTLPDGSSRSLVVIHKEKPTPAIYPRGGAKIKKKPL